MKQKNLICMTSNGDTTDILLDTKDAIIMVRTGKKIAGRTLNETIWKGLPEVWQGEEAV